MMAMMVAVNSYTVPVPAMMPVPPVAMTMMFPPMPVTMTDLEHLAFGEAAFETRRLADHDDIR